MSDDVFVFPATYQQEQLWFLDKLEPGKATYNVPFGCRLRGTVDTNALEGALRIMVGRHEPFRTSFSVVDEKACQVVRPEIEFALRVEEANGFPDAEQRALDEVRRPFDLSKGPLFRALLISAGAEESLLVLTFHHIVFDAWSLGIALEELAGLYNELRGGKTPVVEEPSMQFADFAVWQREALQGEEFEKGLAFWCDELRDAVPALELPTDRPRPQIRTDVGDYRELRLGSNIVTSVKALAREEGATLFMAVFSAFSALLSRYSGQSSIAVGSPVANREREEIENTIGFMANTIALRADLSGNPTFRELLGRVKGTVLGAFEHGSIPFEKVVQGLKVTRDPARNPVFQTMFALQTVPGAAFDLDGLEARPVRLGTATSKFDLLLELTETAGVIDGFLEFNTDLFDGDRIERMLRHLETLMRAAVESPDRAIGDLPLMTDEEVAGLDAWNDTRADFPRDACLHDLVAAQARRTPDAVAVESAGRTLTYRELDRRANHVAHELRSLGAGPGTSIGICVDRSADMLTGLLGILKSGSAYVPLDPDYPRDRLAYMLQDANVIALLTEDALRDELPETDARVVTLAELTGEREDAPGAGASADDLAYVIYTSGSTGRPKGVQLPHRAVVNFLSSMVREPGLRPDDTLLAVTTLSFDIAVLELYGPLLVGARTVIAGRDATFDSGALTRLLASSKATVMQATPATWRLLLNAGWKGDGALKILCGGEAFPRDLVKELLPCGGSVWNMYGPTETTVWSTCFRITDPDAPVLIGKPIDNTTVHVVDDNLNPVPVGVPGELLIGGDGLAVGYRNRDDLTAAAFVPNPFGEGRLYRTGDSVRWNDDGNLEYFQRIDSQVKVRGFRIELGEIESVLGEHASVTQCVATVREDRPGDTRLAGYYIPAGDVTADELRRHLRTRLPDYMIPQHFVELDKIPQTPNGKVDRRALPAPEAGRQTDKEYVPPRRDSEQLIAGAWKHALGVDKVGVHDNFFDLGGHSLLLAELHGRLKGNFDRLSLVDMFRYPTVASLADYLAGDDAADASLSAVQDRGRKARASMGRLGAARRKPR